MARFRGWALSGALVSSAPGDWWLAAGCCAGGMGLGLEPGPTGIPALILCRHNALPFWVAKRQKDIRKAGCFKEYHMQRLIVNGTSSKLCQVLSGCSDDGHFSFFFSLPSLYIPTPSLCPSLFLAVVSDGSALAGLLVRLSRGQAWRGKEVSSQIQVSPGAQEAFGKTSSTSSSHVCVIHQVASSTSKLLPMCKIKWLSEKQASMLLVMPTGHREALCCPLCPQLFTYFSDECLALYFIFIQIITCYHLVLPLRIFSPFILTRVLIISECLYIGSNISHF